MVVRAQSTPLWTCWPICRVRAHLHRRARGAHGRICGPLRRRYGAPRGHGAVHVGTVGPGPISCWVGCKGLASPCKVAHLCTMSWTGCAGRPALHCSTPPSPFLLASGTWLPETHPNKVIRPNGALWRFPCFRAERVKLLGRH